MRSMREWRARRSRYLAKERARGSGVQRSFLNLWCSSISTSKSCAASSSGGMATYIKDAQDFQADGSLRGLPQLSPMPKPAPKTHEEIQDHCKNIA